MVQSKQNNCIDKTDETIDWLNRYNGQGGTIDPIKLKEILYFSLMWNLFELKACDKEANPSNIKQKVNDLHKNQSLQLEDFASFLTYFSDRYSSNGSFDETKFSGLKIYRSENSRRPGELEQKVRLVLEGKINTIDDIVFALLIIVLRLRNNLFHGEKWVYKLDDQVDNFRNANRLLAKFLDAIPLADR